MDIDFPDTVKVRVAALQPEDNPDEHVALLIGERTDDGYRIYDMLPVRNSETKKPRKRFLVTRGDAKRVLRTKGYGMDSIIGLVHTHPKGNPDPSIWDVEDLPADHLGVVYHVPSGTLTYFDHAQGFITKETIHADRV